MGFISMSTCLFPQISFINRNDLCQLMSTARTKVQHHKVFHRSPHFFWFSPPNTPTHRCSVCRINQKKKVSFLLITFWNNKLLFFWWDEKKINYFFLGGMKKMALNSQQQTKHRLLKVENVKRDRWRRLQIPKPYSTILVTWDWEV